LRTLGFRNVACGPDGPEAHVIAEEMNREAIARRTAQDAARAAVNVGDALDMLRTFSEANAALLARSQFEEFETQTVEYRAPVRIQTRPPARRFEWLRSALNTLFHGRNCAV
jgi:hypothetical protein